MISRIAFAPQFGLDGVEDIGDGVMAIDMIQRFIGADISITEGRPDAWILVQMLLPEKNAG